MNFLWRKEPNPLITHETEGQCDPAACWSRFGAFDYLKQYYYVHSLKILKNTIQYQQQE